MRTLTAILLFLALTVVPKNVHSAERTLTIAAASDLTFALNEIVRGFEKDTGIKTVLSFGSTGIFAMQIENGAPFDIFFAANEGYMNRLRENGLILPDSQQIYAQGRIVLAVNKKSGVSFCKTRIVE
ncbi:MAG: molybdate ABC transporter substrate-binding protein [Deltaproteobacteria bacterium]|nr:molybdate ABC transporter substrate-binding protein [Deltaproteobacteria bacterium]